LLHHLKKLLMMLQVMLLGVLREVLRSLRSNQLHPV